MFLSLQPQSGTDVLNKRRRWEGMMCWLTGFYVAQSSSEYCPGRGLKKNFKNFFWKVWSWWKSPYLCSRFLKRSGGSETFWRMCFSSFSDESCRSFLLRRFRKKKFEKKCGKIWREWLKVFIFASAFASWVGRVKEKQKSS